MVCGTADSKGIKTTRSATEAQRHRESNDIASKNRREKCRVTRPENDGGSSNEEEGFVCEKSGCERDLRVGERRNLQGDYTGLRDFVQKNRLVGNCMLISKGLRGAAA